MEINDDSYDDDRDTINLAWGVSHWALWAINTLDLRHRRVAGYSQDRYLTRSIKHFRVFIPPSQSENCAQKYLNLVHLYTLVEERQSSGKVIASENNSSASNICRAMVQKLDSLTIQLSHPYRDKKARPQISASMPYPPYVGLGYVT